MGLKQDLQNDTRFHIDPEVLEVLVKRPISSYKLDTIPVGRIHRLWGHRVFSLYKTKPYTYLKAEDKSEVREMYQNYCQIAKVDKAERSEKTFENLIDTFDESVYDVHKGIIIVDQYDFIVDGQHRSCILLKNYGEAQPVQVLRVHYEDYSPLIPLLNALYLIKKKLHIDC